MVAVTIPETPHVSQTVAALRLRTVTAELKAARLETDGGIRLRIVADGGTTETVLFPAPVSGSAFLDMWTERARQRFVEQIHRPSYEGWTLLYGPARLRLVEGIGRLGPLPVVLQFAAVSEPEAA